VEVVYAKHVIANWPNWQFQHRIKQLKIYSKIYKHISYDYAVNGFILLVTKSSNWETKINKTEIRNLKIENWCIVFIQMSKSLCGVNILYFNCWLLLWLKYQIHAHRDKDNTETWSSHFYTASALKRRNSLIIFL